MMRRTRPHMWTVLALLTALLVTGPGVHGHAADPLIHAVGPIGMTVGDVDRSVKFYSDVLGFEKVSDIEVASEDYERLVAVFGARLRIVRLRLGDELVELTEYLTPRGRPVPVDARSNDRWFQHVAIIASDMDRAYAILQRHGVPHISPAPQRLPDWNPNAGGIRAFYFKDPDDHALELLWFPPDKGDPKWHRPSEHPFLGIDHTAIVVTDTAASLRCYGDDLGLRVAGRSENYGPEQERLNNVFGARLRITTLRAASGPGIEFLEYVTPHDGRPAPFDTRSNDLFHWHTALITTDAEAVHRAARGGGCSLLTPTVVAPADRALGFRRGTMIRDPDGHALEILER